MSQDDFDDDYEEEAKGGSPFDLKVLLLYGAWRSKHWIALCGLLGLGGGLVAAASMPNVYKSVGKLDYRPGLKEAWTEQQITDGGGFDVRSVPGMANELTLLDELEPYLEVAKELGPAAILGTPDPTEGDEDAGLVTRLWHGFQKTMIGLMHPGFEAGDEVTEKAIMGAAKSLKSRTSLYVPPRSQTSIITVLHDGYSPERAQVTNQAILNALQEFHLKLYSTNELKAQAEQTLAIIDNEIAVTDSELQQHTSLCGYKNIEDQRSSFLDQIAEDKKAIATLESGVAGLVRRLKQLETDLAEVDPMSEQITPPVMGPNPEYVFENDIYLDLKRDISDMESKGGSAAVLNRLRASLDKQETKLAGIEKFVEVNPAVVTQVPNPFYLDLFTRRAETTAELEDKRGQLETLTAHLRDNEDHVRKVDECRELHREKQSYLEMKWGERDSARKNLQRTQDQSTLEEEGVSALRLRSNASIPLAKTGPNRIKPLGMAVFAGLALGLFLAVLRQLLDPTVRYRETVEKELDLPILAVVPESRALRRIKPGHVNVA